MSESDSIDLDTDNFRRPNLLANMSFLLGAVTLVAQPLGCIFGLCAIVPLFIGTFAGLGLGLLAYRQAERFGGRGFELAATGIVLGAFNVFVDIIWLVWGMCAGAIVTLIWMT